MKNGNDCRRFSQPCEYWSVAARRLRQWEEENKKLKSLVADLSLDKKMLQDVVSGKV